MLFITKTHYYAGFSALATVLRHFIGDYLANMERISVFPVNEDIITHVKFNTR